MKKITGIKAIGFDGDQTLWDFQKVMRYSLRYTLAELEAADPIAAASLSIDKMIEIRNRVADELTSKTVNLEEVRLEAFKATLAEVGRPDDTLATYLNRVYLQHRFEDIELYEDVLPTLTKLQEKYTIGLLSNGNSYPERCGLEGMFSFIIFAQDHCVEKPDPRFYGIAVEKAGCSKDQLLNVGDSLNKDVIGAAEAGIKGVWLNRDRIKPEPHVEVEYEISSLTELLQLL